MRSERLGRFGKYIWFAGAPYSGADRGAFTSVSAQGARGAGIRSETCPAATIGAETAGAEAFRGKGYRAQAGG